MSDYTTDKKTGLPLTDKADGETLDFPFNFTNLLAEIEDRIHPTVAPTYALTGGITLAHSQVSDYIATPFISGGVAGTQCSVQCTIQTEGGRVFERTFLLNIVERK